MSVLRSIRFPDDTFAILTSVAEKRGLTFNRLVVNLASALAADSTPPLPPEEAQRVIAEVKALTQPAASRITGYALDGSPIYR
jgi:hypothetical protein